jgi:hypothetical protein
MYIHTCKGRYMSLRNPTVFWVLQLSGTGVTAQTIDSNTPNKAVDRVVDYDPTEGGVC